MRPVPEEARRSRQLCNRYAEREGTKGNIKLHRGMCARRSKRRCQRFLFLGALAGSHPSLRLRLATLAATASNSLHCGASSDDDGEARGLGSECQDEAVKDVVEF